MRIRSFVLLALAGVLGLAAVLLARDWMSAQMAARQSAVRVVEPVAPAIVLTKVVVARAAIRFGDPVTAQTVVAVDWPAEAVPPGAYASVEELVTEETRLALRTILENEPVLASKITESGERASLSALIDPGMRAVTIRVNDVLGVAGFVLPGDRVDIMLSREIDGAPITDVLLQSVKVLGIDQDANEQRNEPGVARSMTMEVSTEQAQKLTLASRVGTLSLALRAVAYLEAETVKRVMLDDLNIGEANGEAAPKVAETAIVSNDTTPEITVAEPVDPAIKVAITRGLSRKEYNVDREHAEDADSPAASSVTALLDALAGNGVDEAI